MKTSGDIALRRTPKLLPGLAGSTATVKPSVETLDDCAVSGVNGVPKSRSPNENGGRKRPTPIKTITVNTIKPASAQPSPPPAPRGRDRGVGASAVSIVRRFFWGF